MPLLKIYFLSIVVMATSVTKLLSQVERGGTPESFRILNGDDEKLKAQVKKIPVAKVNLPDKKIIERILTKPLRNQAKAYVMPFSLDFMEKAKVISIEKGSIYLLGVRSKEASRLGIEFGVFDLPLDARFHIYGKERKKVRKPRPGKRISVDKKFFTGSTIGSTLIFELFLPLKSDYRPIICIEEVEYWFE